MGSREGGEEIPREPGVIDFSLFCIMVSLADCIDPQLHSVANASLD